MAGVANNPNSPRQKMINLMYLVFIAMMALNVSSEVLDGFELVEGSLRTSIDNTTSRNDIVAKELEDSYRINQTKVEEWYKKGQNVKNASDSLYNYIQELKERIVKVADGTKGDVNDIQHKDDLEAASRVMLAPINGEGKNLRLAIDSYREMLADMVQDTAKTRVLEASLSTEAPHKAGLNIRTWETALFENMPVAAAITLLTKLQSDIRYTEGEVLSYLLNSVDMSDYRVNKMQAQVIPTSQIVMQGSNYEAAIVLSAIDSTQRPTVFIGETPLPEENGGMFTTRATGLGKQTVSGHIRTFDGATYPFSSDYFVTEAMATVAPVQMNVLYAGYENELRIAVPGVPSENITATMTNGTLVRKNNNHWVARPTTPGTEAIVTVSARMGESTTNVTSNFRVLMLPDPVAYLEYKDANGNTRKFKGGTFSKQNLMAANELLAAYDDGLLDAKFTITQFELVHFDSFGNSIPDRSDGPRFSQRQKDNIRAASRGKRFWISRIKAIGEDKVERDLSPIEIVLN